LRQDNAQFIALMNIAHAIAENAQRLQDDLQLIDVPLLKAGGDTLYQAASKLFSKLGRIADSGGVNPADRIIERQLHDALEDLNSQCKVLSHNRHMPSDYLALLKELSNDSKMLQRDLESAYQASRVAIDPPPLPSRVLIIDGDNANRLVLARYLRTLGHEVETSATSKSVFELLLNNTFDLIFLDLSMPEVNGLDILTEIKSSERWRAIPVVMISGIRDEESVISCIEAGADDFLIKPINRVLLNARVNAGLARKRWHDREQQYLKDLEQSHQLIRDTFGRYVSTEIVDNIMAHPEGLDLGGKTTSASILMADIRGFTTLAEQLPPDKVLRLLNNYLAVMSDIIMGHGGTIDEFIGDAILAIFGAPIDCPDHADRAVACALDMQAAISGINEQNRAQDLPEIGIGVAVNTGEVIAGNIGCAKRVKYGVVGHTVNLTARMESICPAGDILVSRATFNKANRKLKHSREFEIAPKGMVERLQVCNIIGYA
jgi:adenylate cyclase